MKKILSPLHRNNLITLLGLVSVIASCKDNSNVGFTKDESKPINTKDLTPLEDDLQVESQGAEDAEAARRPAFDTEEILKQLIDKEREDRIEGDKSLAEDIQETNTRVDGLEKRMDDFEKHVLSEIERLDAKDAQLDKGILDAKNDYAQKIDELTQDISKDLDAAINEMDANIRTDTEAKIKALEDSVDSKREQLKKEISIVINVVSQSSKTEIQQINNNIIILATQQQADRKALLDKLEEAEQEAMDAIESEKKSRVAEALAIKQELKELEASQNVKMKNLKEDLNGAFDAIEGHKEDIAASKAELAKLQEELISLEESSAKERAKLKSEMEQDIASMEGKLKAYVNNTVEETAAKLNQAREKALEQIRQDNAEEIANAKAEAAASTAALSQDFAEKLAAQGEEINGTIAEVVKALGDKIEAEKTAREAKEKELEALIGENAKESLRKHRTVVKNQIILQINLTLQIIALKESHVDKIKELEEKIVTVSEEARVALEEEKKAREAAIADLDKDLQKSKADAQAARDEMDRELKTLIASQGAQANAKYEELKAELDGIDDDLHAAQLELQKQMHEQEIRTRDKIDEKVGDLEDKVREDYAKLEGQIKEVAGDLSQFKEEVAQKYATKAELAKVKAYADGIKRATNILGKKIDENDASLRHLISEEVKGVKEELSSKISDVQATVEDLKGDFHEHVGEYEKTVAQLSGKITSSVQELREEMVQVRGDFVKEHEALKKSLTEKLESGLANFEIVTQQMKTEFTEKIVQVEGAIDVTHQELVEAKEEAKQRLKEAIAHEVKERLKIQEQLDKLAEELDALRQLAEDTQALAEANSENIAQLRKDFEKQKKLVAAKFQVVEEDLDNKLASMKEDYNQKIQEVSDKSAELVANLGADVQKQMRSLTTNIADLNQKQAANSDALEKFMDEFHSNEQAKADYREGMRLGKEKVVPALENLIHAISEMELVFLQVINPDQNNLPFYDETFKPIMMRCEGNAKATFANALGRDSFQFLAQEYTRQLVHGVEVAKWGGIFHGDGKTLEMGDLQGLLVLDTTRYKVGSDQEECVVDIETWGRHTLFSETKNSQDLRTKLGGSVDLARAVQKVKNAIKDLAEPSSEVETVVAKALEGKADAGKNLQERLPKIVAKIVEASNHAFDLKDRQEMYNKIVIHQENNAPDAATKEQFNRLRAELEAKIAAFTEGVDGRIQDLEDRAGKLETSMKQALEVVATLAHRAGYSDLLTKAIQAGETIGVDIESLDRPFMPKLYMAQHFFGGFGLRNESDACTGNKIMYGNHIGQGQKRGAHDRFHGNTGQCWVNFRHVPNAAWLGTVQNVKFRLFGNAHQIRVRSELGYNKTYEFRTGFASHGTTKHKGYENGVFDIEGSDVVANYAVKDRGWGGLQLSFMPSYLEGDTKVDGPELHYWIQLYSPVVLDFNNVGQLQTMNHAEGVMFDLDNDGVKESTGWVNGREGGLLALDLNKNGKIDGGGELFGQATLLNNGKKANNGYQAMAQYDKNSDGVLDKNDPVFDSLLIWFDRNADGISQAGELKPIAEAGVTKLGVAYGSVAQGKQLNSGNVMKFTSQFWGPENCGAEGCTSYDVFFGTSFQKVATK